MKKTMWVFFFYKYGKFWSILPDKKVDLKPLFSEEWVHIYMSSYRCHKRKKQRHENYFHNTTVTHIILTFKGQLCRMRSIWIYKILLIQKSFWILKNILVTCACYKIYLLLSKYNIMLWKFLVIRNNFDDFCSFYFKTSNVLL